QTAACREGRKAVWTALALFGLVMSHQPITFIAALAVAPLTFVLVIGASWGQWHTFWDRVMSVYGGLLLGAGLCAIFLLPTLLELPLVEAAGGRDDLVPYLQSNFLQLRDVIAYPYPPDLTDLRMFGPRTLGAIGIFFFIIGLVRLIWPFSIHDQQASWRYRVAVLLTLGLGLSLFMLLRASEPVWLSIPYLAQLRFPERFLRLAAIITALGGGAAIMWLPGRWQWLGGWLTIALIVGTMLPHTVPSQPYLDYTGLTARSEIDFEQSQFTWGTTSYNEFNPQWGTSVPLDPPVDPEVYERMPRRIYPLRYWPYEQVGPQSFRITVEEDVHQLVIRQFYYPGWTVTINDERVPIYPEDEHGLISVDVPQGEHIIALHYRGTITQRIATSITVASVLITLGLYQTGKPQRAIRADGSISATAALSSTVIMIGLALLWWRVLIPETSLLRVVSEPDNPAYMDTELSAEFGGQFELLGFTLHQNTIRPNTPLNIDLYWRPAATYDGEQRLRAVVQLVNLDVTETWAVSQPVQLGSEVI
ncbi:MAG: hypothetical protein AAF125_20820, partial [Chloroflexota bacterium]